MSPDSLECMGGDRGHRSVEAFPLNGGHADADDRRGRQGLNVDSCTQRAMTEKDRDSDYSERRGGKCFDSEAGFSEVEPAPMAPICSGGVLGRAKNERLQENFRLASDFVILLSVDDTFPL